MNRVDSRLESFMRRCDSAAFDLGIKRSTLSTKIFNDGKRLDQLASGTSDVGVRRLGEAERALASLLAHATSEAADAR